jgi:hypothetical protein
VLLPSRAAHTPHVQPVLLPSRADALLRAHPQQPTPRTPSPSPCTCACALNAERSPTPLVRLGSMQDACADSLGAAASMRTALKLMGDDAQVAAKLADVETRAADAVAAAAAAAGGPADGPRARAAARLCKAEAASTAAAAVAARASRAVERAEKQKNEFVMAGKAELMGAAQGEVDDAEAASEGAAEEAAAAAALVSDARTLVSDTALADEHTRAAAGLYAQGELEAAHGAFSQLIATATAAAAMAAAHGQAAGSGIAAWRRAEACAALPALLSNRAACALQMESVAMSECLADCDAALAAHAAAAAAAAARSANGESDGPPPPPPPLKMRLRRLEVWRRLGHAADAVATELEELRQMAQSDKEKQAVEYAAAAAGAGVCV